MKLKLLVGSREFWDALRSDIAAASSRVLVQTLSFEGDHAGLGLARALRECRAPDRRIVVDEFTRWIQNDRFLVAPRNLMDPHLRSEVRATWDMIQELEAEGVGIRWVNPWGFLWRRGARRNHKKLIVVDDRIAYIGGINFSEHNFAWHDMMLRMEHEGVGAYCREDFEHTWAGRDVPSSAQFPGVRLMMLDARHNHRLFQEVLDRIAAARKEIVVESPYLSFPFTEALADASSRGVRIRLITPGGNNRGFLKRYICWEGARCGMAVHLFDGMTHLKAMLIDDEALVMGSSNFDYLSYRAHQEVVAVLTDAAVIADFRARVIEPDLARSEEQDRALAAADPWGVARRMQMRLGGWIMAELADW